MASSWRWTCRLLSRSSSRPGEPRYRFSAASIRFRSACIRSAEAATSAARKGRVVFISFHLPLALARRWCAGGFPPRSWEWPCVQMRVWDVRGHSQCVLRTIGRQLAGNRSCPEGVARAAVVQRLGSVFRRRSPPNPAHELVCAPKSVGECSRGWPFFLEDVKVLASSSPWPAGAPKPQIWVDVSSRYHIAQVFGGKSAPVMSHAFRTNPTLSISRVLPIRAAIRRRPVAPTGAVSPPKGARVSARRMAT